MIQTINAPALRLDENQTPPDILLNFYRDLGWNSEDDLHPTKVVTTNAVFNGLIDSIIKGFEDGNYSDSAVDDLSLSVGIFVMNKGPSVDGTVEEGKVHLHEGWVTNNDQN